MRRFAAVAFAAAALVTSAGSASAFFNLFDAQPADPFYRADPNAHLQVAPVPREIVPFHGYAPGTVVVSTSERRLYYVLGGGQAGAGGPGAGLRSKSVFPPDWSEPVCPGTETAGTSFAGVASDGSTRS